MKVPNDAVCHYLDQISSRHTRTSVQQNFAIVAADRCLCERIFSRTDALLITPAVRRLR
jgi:hypothetical protein